jgi:hypothetical protein
MPRFFFHLINDLDVPDPDGEELPDLDTARDRAAKNAREMMALSLVETGRIARHHRIEVSDESGKIVHVARFGDVLTIEG